jgi:hypothetical protein
MVVSNPVLVVFAPVVVTAEDEEPVRSVQDATSVAPFQEA